MSHGDRSIRAKALELRACAGRTLVGGSKPGATHGQNDAPRCTPREGVDAEAERASCTAKGCSYTQQLTCRGIDVDEETRRSEREASEAGKVPCACVCEADVTACGMVP